MGLSHADLVAGLATRYAAPHWILLQEVADASGFRGKRSIDALAFGLYDSRGYEVHAFEAKASRADLRRELDDPDKADLFARIADRFYIVAPGPDVARPEDLPATWGLLYVGANGRVRTAKQIPAARPRGKIGDPLPRPLVAAMLTRMQKRAQAAEAALAAREVPALDPESYDKGYRAGLDEKRVQREQDELRASVAAFEAATGLTLTRWSGGRLGREVAEYLAARRALAEGGGIRIGRAEQGLRAALEDAQDAVDRLVALRAAVTEASAVLGRTG